MGDGIMRVSQTIEGNTTCEKPGSDAGVCASRSCSKSSRRRPSRAVRRDRRRGRRGLARRRGRDQDHRARYPSLVDVALEPGAIAFSFAGSKPARDAGVSIATSRAREGPCAASAVAVANKYQNDAAHVRFSPCSEACFGRDRRGAGSFLYWSKLN